MMRGDYQIQFVSLGSDNFRRANCLRSARFNLLVVENVHSDLSLEASQF